ncbi:MAG: hypothetical protein ACI8XO_002497, partial [Verrucomicrobiales bacterium]
ASLLALPACKKKEADPAPAAEEVAEAVASSKPSVELDASGVSAQRSQAFGFLSRMPASTEGAFGMRNLSDVFAGLLESNIYKRALALSQEAGGMGFDPQQAQMAQVAIDQYVGKELFVIFSEGAGEQFGRLQLISSLLSELNMRTAGETIAGGGAAGGPEVVEGMAAVFRDGLKDEDSTLSKTLEAFQFPPMIMGSKVSDGADEMIAQLTSMEDALPAIFTVRKFEVGGGQFTSWKLVLQDVITEEQEAEINEFLQDKVASKRVADILRRKSIEFTFGQVDNYLLITLGNDHSHLQFVSKPEESILAASAFGFSDQFLAKKLVGYSFLSNSMLKGGAEGGQIERMAKSLASGMAGGDADMKRMGGLIEKLGGNLEKLSKRSSQTHVGVAYMENGIHGESIGGYTSDLIDSKSKSLFANSAPADAAMVLSAVANPEHRGETIAMLETVFSLIDTGSDVWAKNSGDEQVGQMKQLFGENLTKVWGIMRGKFIEGLGSQSGVIVDLNGSLPKGIPNLNIPRVIQNEGKMPRIALATDVKDRAKLTAAWEELVPALNEAAAKIPGQEPGAEFQVPDTITDESDALVTHYFPIPFTSKDFLPSISVNDDLFFMSTSKQLSESLAGSAKAAGGEIRGSYMMMNFVEVQSFAENWIQLVLQNSDTVFSTQAEAMEFQETAGQAQKLMEFTRGIRSLKANRYQTDEGAMRSSWHLHLEDIGEEVD